MRACLTECAIHGSAWVCGIGLEGSILSYTQDCEARSGNDEGKFHTDYIHR